MVDSVSPSSGFSFSFTSNNEVMSSKPGATKKPISGCKDKLVVVVSFLSIDVAEYANLILPPASTTPG